MSFEKILIGNNKGLFPEIISVIPQIAIDLSEENQVLTRRSLVRKLNERISNLNLADGLYVKSLVREAYLAAKHSPSIQKAISESFIDNIGDDLVYDPDRIFVSSSSLNFDGDNSFDEFYQKVELLNNNIKKLESIDAITVINDNLKEIELMESQWVLSITGRKKVESVYNHATKIYNEYEYLIYRYERLRDENENLFCDFKFLRNELKYLREDIIQILFDIVGDKKLLPPELFDFSKVEWLEVENFRRKLDLAFDDIDEKFEVFRIGHKKHMNNILKAGAKHAGNAFDNSAKIAKKRGGLTERELKTEFAVAGIGLAVDAVSNIIEARKDADKTVALLKQDIKIIKYNLREDAQIIISDLIRLQSIYKNLKDKLIPNTKSFIDIVQNIFKNKLIPPYKKVVSNSTIADLRDENIKLASENRKIILELEDKNEGIEICRGYIAKYQDLISEIKFEYDYVINLKPSTPSAFYNIVSFGNANKSYKTHLESWEIITEPVRTLYDSYIQSLNIEEETVKLFDNILVKLGLRKEEIIEKLNLNSLSIKEQVQTIDNIKPELKILMIEIFKISKASKQVLETGIDEILITPSEKISSKNNQISTEEILDQDLSLRGLSEKDISFLDNKKFQMKLKVGISQLLTDTLVTGTFVEEISTKLKEYVTIKIPDGFISEKLRQLNSQIVNALAEGNPKVISGMIESKKDKIISYLDSRRNDNSISKAELDSLSSFIQNGLVDLNNQMISALIDKKAEAITKIIEDQKEKVRVHLTTKLLENLPLNDDQANKLVSLGFDVFASMLENQKINAETDYLKHLNERLDQQFLNQFGEKVELFKLFVIRNREEAILIDEILNNAYGGEDLLKAANLINKRGRVEIYKSEEVEIDGFLNGNNLKLEL